MIIGSLFDNGIAGYLPVLKLICSACFLFYITNSTMVSVSKNIIATKASVVRVYLPHMSTKYFISSLPDGFARFTVAQWHAFSCDTVQIAYILNLNMPRRLAARLHRVCVLRGLPFLGTLTAFVTIQYIISSSSAIPERRTGLFSRKS